MPVGLNDLDVSRKLGLGSEVTLYSNGFIVMLIWLSLSMKLPSSLT